jgi:D-serine deaminase-like pyridoxal phosphate-dependent protein
MASYDDDAVQALREAPISPQEKGFGGPLHREPVTARELAGVGAHESDGWLGSPRVLVRRSALEHNVSQLARYCRERDVALYPHGKTTMAPQVVAAQLDAGASGVTVATVAQARTFDAFAMGPVLIANQVVDAAGTAWLAHATAAELPSAPTCYVDSLDGVQLLDDAVARRTERRLPVVVELGHTDGRTGARGVAQARALAEAVARTRALRLVGVAGYEGSIVRPTPAETFEAARAFCAELAELTTDLLATGLLPDHPMVTAGGSAYFDAVVDVLGGEPSWQLVLRSGCYVTHDHGLYQAISPFERSDTGFSLRPALQVVAPVLSRPDRETVVVGAGRRDVSSDSGLPVLVGASRSGTSLSVDGATPQRLFDQHLVVSVPAASDLRPGDEVELGVSHPCTTFDKWRRLPVVDDDGRVVDVLTTFF